MCAARVAYTDRWRLKLPPAAAAAAAAAAAEKIEEKKGKSWIL
jgi:hypothetical protein